MDTHRTDSDGTHWYHGHDCTTLREQFTHMIRASSDPEEKLTRGPNGTRGKRWGMAPHNAIKKMDPADIRKHLIKGLQELPTAPTLNHLGLHVFDLHADIIHGSKVDDELWDMVEQGLVAHTGIAPIRWTLVADHKFIPACALEEQAQLGEDEDKLGEAEDQAEADCESAGHLEADDDDDDDESQLDWNEWTTAERAKVFVAQGKAGIWQYSNRERPRRFAAEADVTPAEANYVAYRPRAALPWKATTLDSTPLLPACGTLLPALVRPDAATPGASLPLCELAALIRQFYARSLSETGARNLKVLAKKYRAEAQQLHQEQLDATVGT